VSAGVARVVFAQSDPNPDAAGGAEQLHAAGIQVTGGVLAEEAAELNERWARTVALGRPLVTWKLATTLDGRSAAVDGSSQWITGEVARADVHRLRATRDAVVVGTGTVLTDDPRLTVREPDDALGASQPLRVVMGLRDVPATARVHDGPGDVVHLATRDPHAALDELWHRGVRDVWLEGGPSLAASFLRAGLVDDVYAYVAPALLGAGRAAVADLGIESITDVRRLDLVDVEVVGGDVRIHAVPRPIDATPDASVHENP
jgi:diaminohydroxyphosphoribosylaminopyrimidine deaminase/5-amino-6-(5-phosphoribosylamino)uracil reductase